MDEVSGEALAPLENVLDGRAATGLVRSLALSRGQTLRTRVRGETMVELAQLLTGRGVGAEISVHEADGATWSMTISAQLATDGDARA